MQRQGAAAQGSAELRARNDHMYSMGTCNGRLPGAKCCCLGSSVFHVEAPGLKTASLDMGSGGCSLHSQINTIAVILEVSISLTITNVDMGSGCSLQVQNDKYDVM